MSNQADALNRELTRRGVLKGTPKAEHDAAQKSLAGVKPQGTKSAKKGKPEAFDAEKLVEEMNLWWENGSDKYFRLQDEPFPVLRWRAADLKRQLRLNNVSPRSIEGQTFSHQDVVTDYIQRARAVDFTGPLSGKPVGVYDIQGRRVLVTSSYSMVEPAEGDWPLLRGVLTRMLTTSEADQTAYFFAWMKVAIQALQMGKARAGHALIFAGPTSAGKSFVQEHVITPLLGGRSATPLNYLLGKTTFNAEMAGAEHLTIQEMPLGIDQKSRAIFGEELKRLIATESHSLHPKYCDPITFYPWWRVTISVNDSIDRMKSLPPLTSDFGDKVILLLCQSHLMPMPTDTPYERDEFRRAIYSELPAFVHFLENWEIPEEIRKTKHASRFGLDHYHHPILASMLFDDTPEANLLYILDNRPDLYANGAWGWESAQTLESVLTDDMMPGAKSLLGDVLMVPNQFRDQARKIFNFSGSAGTYLHKLSGRFPARVKKTHGNKGNVWMIYPPSE